MPEMVDEQLLKKLQLELDSTQVLAKKRAIFEIVRLKATHFLAQLQRMATYDDDVEVRYYASKAINFIRPPPAQPPAGEAVPTAEIPLTLELAREDLSNPESEVRLHCLQRIVQLNDQAYAPLVKQLCERETDPVVRASLPLAVAVMGGPDAKAIIAARFLKDPQSRVRANAIEALEKLGDPSVYTLIIGFLQDRDNRVRANAAVALHRFGKVNLLKTLGEMIGHPKVWMRDSAAYALSIIKIAEAVPLLARAMEDPYGGIKAKAKKGLTQLAAKGIVEAQQVLDRFPDVKEEESLDDFLRLAAMETGMAAGGEAMDLPPPKGIAYELAGDDPKVRAAEAKRVADNQDVGVAPRLLERTKDERDVTVRVALMSALGKLGFKPAANALIASLSETDLRIRTAAIDAIGLLKVDSAMVKVLPCLKDPNMTVVVRAIVALKEYPHFDILMHLRGMVANRREEQRKAALAAIKELRTYNALPLLENLARDRVNDIRFETLSFLRELGKEGNVVAKGIILKLGGIG